MIVKIFMVILFAIYYLHVCSFVSVYWPECIVAKRYYIIVKNKILWTLLVGKFRGRNKIPDTDFYKMTLFGLASYILLVPCLLFFSILYVHPIVQLWPYNSTQTFILSILPPTIVLFLNAIDQIVGGLVITFKKTKQGLISMKTIRPKILSYNESKLQSSFSCWRLHYPQILNVLYYKKQADLIFKTAEKIVYDTDVKEYYFIRGNDLLRVDIDGQFIDLSPSAQSMKVLTAFRLGIVLKADTRV